MKAGSNVSAVTHTQIALCFALPKIENRHLLPLVVDVTQFDTSKWELSSPNRETTRRLAEERSIKMRLTPGETFTFFFPELSFGPKLKVAGSNKENVELISICFVSLSIFFALVSFHETKDKRDTMKRKKEKICLVERVNPE